MQILKRFWRLIIKLALLVGLAIVLLVNKVSVGHVSDGLTALSTFDFYSLLVTVFGTVGGFLFAVFSIVIGHLSSDKFNRLKESGDCDRIWHQFSNAILFSFLLFLFSLISVVLIRFNLFNPWITLFTLLATYFYIFSLAESFSIFNLMNQIVLRREKAVPIDPKFIKKK
jgi:hypothetical protein